LEWIKAKGGNPSGGLLEIMLCSRDPEVISLAAQSQIPHGMAKILDHVQFLYFWTAAGAWSVEYFLAAVGRQSDGLPCPDPLVPPDLNSSPAFAVLVQGLDHYGEEVEEKALWRLLNFEDPRSTPFFLKRLSDPDARKAKTAAKFLGEQGDPAAIEPLRERLRRTPLPAGNDEALRKEILLALLRFGDRESLPALWDLYGTLDEEEVKEMKEVLKDLKGDRWQKEWIIRLESKDPQIRTLMVQLVGETKEASLAESIVPLCLDKVPAVRVEALKALRSLGKAGDIVTVRRLLDDPDETVRAEAVEAVVSLDPSREETLILALDRPSPVLRRRCAKALQERMTGCLFFPPRAKNPEAIRQALAAYRKKYPGEWTPDAKDRTDKKPAEKSERAAEEF
jgi:HEAT repeat protein